MGKQKPSPQKDSLKIEGADEMRIEMFKAGCAKLQQELMSIPDSKLMGAVRPCVTINITTL